MRRGTQRGGPPEIIRTRCAEDDARRAAAADAAVALAVLAAAEATFAAAEATFAAAEATFARSTAGGISDAVSPVAA